jgi:hypothetical protein
MIDEDLERARHASALLDNPLLNEILSDLKQTYVNQWLASKPEDYEVRERLYLASRLADEFSSELQIAIQNGKIAKAALKRKQERQ